MTNRSILPRAATACLLTALAVTWPRSSNAAPPAPPNSQTWTFDSLDDIGGHKPAVYGEPRVIDTPLGKAVEFDGVDDALFFDVHPLAGAATFTWEAIFRPDGGAEEQRWFHLSETPAPGADTENRMLFEIRVVEGQWCLDTYVQTGDARKALLDRRNLHPLGAWHHVAANSAATSTENRTEGPRSSWARKGQDALQWACASTRFSISKGRSARHALPRGRLRRMSS